MKILHLSTTDVKGGAGIAAHRLHQGSFDGGVESSMYVQRKYGDDNLVFCSQNKIRKFLIIFARPAIR